MPEPKFDGKIEKIALHLSRLMDNAAYYEIKMKETKEEIKKISTEELPELMETEGFKIGSKVILKNGKTVTLNEIFTANMPTEAFINKTKDPDKQLELTLRRKNGLAWLNNNDVGAIIKKKIVAEFDSNDEKFVDETIKKFTEMGILHKKEQAVNAATLKATLKEVMKNGKEVPFDLFDIFSGTIVNIK